MTSLRGGITFPTLVQLMWKTVMAMDSRITRDASVNQAAAFSSARPAHSFLKASLSEKSNYTMKAAW